MTAWRKACAEKMGSDTETQTKWADDCIGIDKSDKENDEEWMDIVMKIMGKFDEI